jgi:hypothetical protein
MYLPRKPKARPAWALIGGAPQSFSEPRVHCAPQRQAACKSSVWQPTGMGLRRIHVRLPFRAAPVRQINSSYLTFQPESSKVWSGRVQAVVTGT